MVVVYGVTARMKQVHRAESSAWHVLSASYHESTFLSPLPGTVLVGGVLGQEVKAESCRSLTRAMLGHSRGGHKFGQALAFGPSSFISK